MRQYACSLLAALLLGGCTSGAVATSTVGPVATMTSPLPTTIARPAPSPVPPATPGTPQLASPTILRPTVATPATPTRGATPVRNGNVAILAGHTGPVDTLAWSPDGQTLAVGAFVISNVSSARSFSGVVRLWRPDGQLLTTIRTQMTGGKFFHLAWSPDGTLLAGGAIDFYLWRADGTVVVPLRGGGTPAPAMAFSPRGDRIAIGDENGVVILLDNAGKGLNAVREGSNRGVAFSPDGRTLALISNLGVSLLDTGNPTATPREIHSTPFSPARWSVSNLAWSPDGTRLAAATTDGVLRLWRTDGTPLTILDGCPGTILRVAWSPDGRVLAAGSEQHAVCLWRE